MANKNFEIEVVDQPRLIKNNDLKVITNPSMFTAGGSNTPDGLLSDDIFGITKEDRSEIFAYLDLNEYFLQPYIYKVWLKLDKNIRSIIYETNTFKIDSKGHLVADPDGETGLKFLRKNIDKINFKTTKRESLLNVLNKEKKDGKIFTKQFIITPPFYRDVNNNNGRIGVGEINKLYANLMNNIKALQSSNDYGLSMAGGIRGKIQDIMLEIYNWYTIGESVAGGEHTGAGIFKKFGIMHRSVRSKTTDYSSRLVLSAPEINVDKKEDLMVDMDHVKIPLAAACTIFYPFMIFALRSFFNNEFGGKEKYKYINKNGDVEEITLLNPQIEFSDDRLDKEINKIIHGYSNRFERINIPNKEGKHIALRFKGYQVTSNEYSNGIRENSKMIERDMTWCDLLYMTAVDVSQDKMVMVTRYPIDSYFNQFSCGANIACTVDYESMVINGKLYRWYPKIKQEDIGSNTANKFVDTCSIANPYCVLMGADYDGDQVTVKACFTIEANEELKKYKDSNAQFITIGGDNGRVADKEAIQAMYNLTLVLPESKSKLTNPKF